MTAYSPWSGHYTVDDPIWASAHTTQFTEVGWLYSALGAGSGWLPQGGSFVTLVPPPAAAAVAGSDPTAGAGTDAGPTMTMVIEKMDPAKSKCEWEGVGNSTTPQNETASFQLHGALATIKSLNVWRSRIGSAGVYSHGEVFQGLAPIAVDATGRFSIELCADCVFTLTTVTTGQKGSFGTTSNRNSNTSNGSVAVAAVAAAAGVPNVTGWVAAVSPAGFSDDFDGYNLSSEAAYWSDMAGSWEIVHAISPSPPSSTTTSLMMDPTTTTGVGRKEEEGVGEGSSGNKVMRQMVPDQPIFGIRTEVRPLSMIGEKNWGDTNLTIDAMVEADGSGVYIGVNFIGLTTGPGYFLAVEGARWSTAVSVGNIGSANSSTQSGALPAGLELTPGSWRQLSLSVEAGKASASIDGHALFTAVSTTEAAGSVAAAGFGVMGTIGYTPAQFDNFHVKAAYNGPPPSPTPPPPSPGPGPHPQPSPSPPNPTAPAKCMPPAAGQSVRLWTCDPSRDATQGWNVTASALSSGQRIAMLHAPSLCLGVGSNKLMELVACDSRSALSFTAASGAAGSIELKTTVLSLPAAATAAVGGQEEGGAAAECLDVAPHPDKKLGGSCPLDIWSCNSKFDGGANQQFVLAGAHTSNPVGAIVSELWGKDLCVSVCEAPASAQ
jgi:hypothetical protein